MVRWLWLTLIPLAAFTESRKDVSEVSEAMGHQIRKHLDDLGLDFDIEALAKGLIDEERGLDSPMTEDECEKAILTLQEEKMQMTFESELEEADAISNGTQIENNENRPIPTTDSSKHR